jgi:hypothetical protein
MRHFATVWTIISWHESRLGLACIRRCCVVFTWRSQTLNDEPTAPAKQAVQPDDATKPWVEPKLVRLEAEEARAGSSHLYDGLGFSS